MVTFGLDDMTFQYCSIATLGINGTIVKYLFYKSFFLRVKQFQSQFLKLL